MSVPATIGIEAELAGDSRTMFRLRVNGRIVGESLTAAQAHLLVGDVLERIVLPNKKGPWASESVEGGQFGRRAIEVFGHALGVHWRPGSPATVR